MMPATRSPEGGTRGGDACRVGVTAGAASGRSRGPAMITVLAIARRLRAACGTTRDRFWLIRCRPACRCLDSAIRPDLQGVGGTGWTLSRRALGGGPWTRITARASNSGVGGIATQAGVAALVDGSSVLVTANGGLTVTKHPTPCPAAGSPFPVVTSVAVQAPHGLALLCTGQGYTGHTDKTVYVSGDLGATWKLAGHPASAGDGGMIAASAPGHLTIATTSAASWLYYSADNGRTWRTAVTYLDGGQGWNDLGFTTTRDGVVIHGHPAYGDMLGQLLLTDNGGLTWHAVTF
jgi:hypothetical protein